jgi:hypothetical protein
VTTSVDVRTLPVGAGEYDVRSAITAERGIDVTYSNSIVAILMGSLMAPVACKGDPPKPVAEPAQAPIPVAVAPKEPSILDRLARAQTLSAALEITVPLMKDVGNGDPVSIGGLALAQWMSSHDFWTELLKMPDTKRAEILKDSDEYRGRRVCIQGSIVEIARDKSLPFKLYVGGMMANYSAVRFLSVGSTEGILEGKLARFCGITPGLQSYANVSGGETHAVQLIGAFDLKYAPDYE